MENNSKIITNLVIKANADNGIGKLDDKNQN